MNNERSLSPEAAIAVERKIDSWKSRLLDFSRRNRLLFYKPTQSSTVEILSPPPAEFYDRLVVKGKSVVFPSPKEGETQLELSDEQGLVPTKPLKGNGYLITNPTEKQLNRVLYNLRTRARIAREEQGVNILFAALGMLHWRDSQQGELVQAPLILVPVDLIREAPGQPYQLAMIEEDIVLNPTLQEMLRQYYRIELPDFPDDLDAAGLLNFWQAVHDTVRVQPDWKVEPRTVLSTFSYQKQMMVADLEKNRNLLANHPLIRSMSIPGFPLPSHDLELIRAEELDDRVPLQSTFQVLDADSSQQEAIQAAKAGLSFVLQGPPGTGKSQTIANIIAEFLGEGRKVLFISAKMAALEVVQNRLNRVGLGDFCLQVHSFRRDKREVVEELGKSLEAQPASPPRQLTEKLSALENTRNRINRYVRALHQPGFKLGFSAFQAYAELARLKDAPKLSYKLARITDLTSEEHHKQREIVAQLSTFPQVIESYSTHPWLGCSITGLSLQLKNEIEDVLHHLIRDIGQFENQVAVLAASFGVKKPQSLNEGWELIRTAYVFTPGVLEIPIKDIRKRYETLYSSKTRLFRFQYWRDSSLLRNLSHQPVRPDPEKVIKDLELAERVQTRRIETRSREFGDEEVHNRAKELYGLGRQIKGRWEFISSHFNSEQRPKEVDAFLTVTYGDSIRWCERHLIQMDSLRDWANFNRLRQEANEVGLEAFVTQGLEAGIKASHWVDAFLRQFYLLYIDAIHHYDESLLSFRGESHQIFIDQFRALDGEQIRLAHQNIRARILQHRPQAGWMNSASTEEAILRRELNKKRRLKPLRRLFTEIPDLILTLRPCLMMSPLTVSQLLNTDLYRFDLVIFDEASQVHPEEAIGAIVRARQVIIVGDRHQLPPTSFFEILDSDDGFNEDETAPEDFESILNESDAAGLPSKMLMWHYRSKDESLIAFSNYHFYHNRLLTFPAAVRNPKAVGVELIYVPDGIYRRGGGSSYNAVEAGRVVNLILQHYQSTPDLSLGVVTFSQAQRDMIQMELDRVLKDRPDLQPFFTDAVEEPFFVKNLELVQGDERDVMIFSVGYGRDEAGKFLLNFGPLNREGGERRLNVAVTRARCRVKLVASIQPEEIDLSRTNSRGVKLLLSYMLLARDGLRALYADTSLDPEADFESPFEKSVYDALTDRGLRLQKQVGVSSYRIDLAVIDPDRPGSFLLGIECDGAMYHAAATARDRDRLRQQVLENLGWKIHRIWSRDWIEDREREIQKVLNAVQLSQQQGLGNAARSDREIHPPKDPPGAPEHQNPRFETDLPQQTGVKSDLPPGTQRYREAKLQAKIPGTESFYKTPMTALVTIVKKVVDAEGPIDVNLAKRRITDAWEISRVGQRISQTLDQAIALAVRSGKVKQRGNFLWPENQTPIAPRVPKNGQGQRSIEEIPPEELAEGVFLCVKSALSMTREDLNKQTAWLFGLRANQKVLSSIEAEARKLIHSGRLEWRGGKIRLPQT